MLMSMSTTMPDGSGSLSLLYGMVALVAGGLTILISWFIVRKVAIVLAILTPVAGAIVAGVAAEQLAAQYPDGNALIIAIVIGIAVGMTAVPLMVLVQVDRLMREVRQLKSKQYAAAKMMGPKLKKK